MKKLMGLALLAAAAKWLFDSSRGGRRREELQQRVRGLVGRGSATGDFGDRDAAAAGTGGPPNDETLTQRVRSELFRDEEVPKGQINVNAQGGVVQLRGEVPSEDMISTLVEKARSVHGVEDVENLLHTPGRPAPMHQ